MPNGIARWESARAITLVASVLPTIYASPIANSPGVLLASRVKAGLRGW
jgi:hypothetical protein